MYFVDLDLVSTVPVSLQKRIESAFELLLSRSCLLGGGGTQECLG